MLSWTRSCAIMALVWIALALSAACSATDERALEPRVAYELIERNSGKNFLILDVRTAEEFRRGFVDGAVFMDYYATDFRERFAALDRDLTILTYCHVGSRSSEVLALADSLGFRQVYDLRGGILAWVKAGLPLARNGADPVEASGPPPS